MKAFGFGSVNRAVLDNRFVIPIYSRPTVGQAQLNLQLRYDSQFWKVGSNGWAPGLNGVYNGWQIWVPFGQVTTNQSIDYSYCGWQNNVTGNLDQWYNLVTDDYSFTEPDGTLVLSGLPENQYYQLGGGSRQSGDENTCYTLQQGPSTITIPDGKGYTAVLNNQGYSTAQLLVYNAAGDQISDAFVDINANKVTSSTAGGVTTYTDPLGTVLTQSGSGTPASPIVFAYTGPSGSPVDVTEDFTTISVATSFGCAGINEWSGSLTVPSELDLPDGRKYTFSYNNDGQIASVTLPTGGTVNYTYQVDCASHGSANASLTRWDSVDGSGNAWSWSLVDEGGGVVQTTETQPGTKQNQERFTFAAPQWSGESGPLTEEDDYSGPVSGGAELRSASVAYTYTNGYVSDEDVHVTRYAENGAPNRTRETDVKADVFGSTTTETDYAWGGGLLREVTTTLATVNNVADLPTEVVVSDGSTTASDTKYGYDSVGNLQSIGRVNGSATLTTSFVIAPNGNITSITAPNGAVTSISYATSAPGCAGPRGFGLFPTSVQYPVSGLTTSAVWNCTGGVATSSTDLNGHATDYSYGGNTWQPTSITDPASNTANVTYPSGSSPDVAESAMTFNGGNSVADVRTIVDGLGRPIFTQRRQSPTSSNYDTVETEYDALGRVTAVSQPFTASSNPAIGAGSDWTSTVYDALSRPLSVTDAAGGYVDYTYAGDDVLLARGPAAANSPLIQKQEQFDALGRLQSVCEVTTASGSGACGQTVARTGYLTSYARNASGEITGVTQGVQTRSFSFDELGRLTQEVNPETGTTKYYFGSAPACATQTGALAERLDNAGNVTCYAHDALERVTVISYPTVVAPFAATPSKTFVYDAATVDGQAMLNAAGRVAEAYTGSRATDLGLSYGLLGNPTSAVQQVSGGAWITVTESYYPNGVVASLSVPGVPTISYGLDGEGRPTTVSASAGQSPVTAAVYSALGLSSFTLGSGDGGSYVYDAATGRRTGHTFTVAGAADTAQLSWNANGTLASLGVSDAIPGATDNGLSCAYSHDELGRVSEANCGSTYNETFAWDQWGNHNSGNTPSGLVTNFSFSGNQIAGASYNGDGDLVSDPLLGGGTNQFDAEGRAVSLWGTAAAYDALGREVAAGSNTVLYAPNGAKLGLMSGGTVEDVEIPLPGGSAAVYNASGLELYRSADWLGSAALTTTPGGALASTDHYTPFGFDVTGAGAEYRGFSGQHQWTDTTHTGGQYDFMYREYNPEQGRWWTPDPSGLAAVDPGNPQTWNRYAYVAGTPLSATDPLGLDAWCTAGGCGQSGMTITVGGSPDLGMLLGGPSGSRAPGGCIVENRNPNDGRGHIVSTVYRRGERPRLEYVSAPDCGGGYYGGGGGAGGWRSGPLPQPHPPAPSLWAGFKGWAASKLACPDNFADKYSLAGLAHHLGIGNHGGAGAFFTNALGGNIVAGIAEGVFRQAPGDAATLIVGSGTGLGLLRGGATVEGLGGTAIKAAAGGVWSAVTGAGETITTLAGEASLASTGTTAASFASGIGWVKLGYDAAAWGAGILACIGRN